MTVYINPLVIALIVQSSMTIIILYTFPYIKMSDPDCVYQSQTSASSYCPSLSPEILPLRRTAQIRHLCHGYRDPRARFVRTRRITSSVNSLVVVRPRKSTVRTPSATASKTASAMARPANSAWPPLYLNNDAPARIIAIGLATFFLNNNGAVPCGASAITTRMAQGSSNANNNDSAPAMDPNSCRINSLRQSPSRFNAGTTNPSVASVSRSA